MIRFACEDDAPAISRIYNHYVSQTTVTFEIEPVSDCIMVDRIREVSNAALPWFVYEDDDTEEILGYAYANKWKGRCAYRHSVESTVYLHSGKTGKGLGTALYDRLLNELQKRGIHVVIGGIALPNFASVALHEKMGFQNAGHFAEVGRKFDRWIDVGYWHRFL